jgi:hypothetical protein
MKQTTSKLQAVLDIIYDARTQRSSKASLKRLRRAGRSLELADEEQREVEAALEYRPSASEDVYQWHQDGKKKH